MMSLLKSGFSKIIFLAASNRTSASQMRKVELKEKERYRDNSVIPGSLKSYLLAAASNATIGRE